jgi:hypothetical protein
MERTGPPVFDVLVEAIALDKWRVHGDVAASVDAVLASAKPAVQVTAVDDRPTCYTAPNPCPHCIPDATHHRNQPYTQANPSLLPRLALT